MTLLSADGNEFCEETREISPTNFLIKIEHFSLLKKNGIDKYESRAFEAGGYQWKMIIYPEGKKSSKNEEESHVSVYFTITETDSLLEGWEVNAIFTFFALNQLLDYYHCFRGMPRRFNGVSNKWGFSKLMSKEDLMDSRKGFLVDDCCVFGAEVFVIRNEERINERLSLVEVTSPFKREWKISDFCKLGDDVWNSEVFYVQNYNWRIEVHPNGETSHTKDRYISIFVECDTSLSFAPHEKVKAEIYLRIKSKLNEIDHAHKYTHWYTSSSTIWGEDEFITIDDIGSKGFLVDDCCFLEVEISVQARACA